MIIKHITHIGCAINIVHTGTFNPISTNPLNGDAGMNCLNGNEINDYANKGVLMKFIWSGPDAIYKKDGEGRPYSPNFLYDNGPWRLVVPIGTTEYLKFDSIEIMDASAFDEYIESNTSIYHKLPFTNWRLKEKSKFVDFFRINKNKNISIGK